LKCSEIENRLESNTNLFDELGEVLHFKRVRVTVIKMCQKTLLVNGRYIQIHVSSTFRQRKKNTDRHIERQTPTDTRIASGKAKNRKLQNVLLEAATTQMQKQSVANCASDPQHLNMADSMTPRTEISASYRKHAEAIKLAV